MLGGCISFLYILSAAFVAILDSNETDVVQYKHDAWGRHISKTGSMSGTLGTVQPFLYRGYVYAEETELYYLRSRYYSKLWARFINADILLSDLEELNFKNLYTYCSDSPIVRKDADGYLDIENATSPYQRQKIPDIQPSGSGSRDGGAGGGFIPPSLGTGNISVYISKLEESVVQYVGITNDIRRRAGEHFRQKGIEIITLITNMSQKDAKAVEQTLITFYGKQKYGGTLLNLYYSIAPGRQEYPAILELGLAILELFGLDP